MPILMTTLVLAAVQTPPVEPPKMKPEKKVCRAVQSTGSRMGGGRECRTKEEWARIDGQGTGDGIEKAHRSIDPATRNY